MQSKVALAADVTFTIDAAAAKHPISRYIYGINGVGLTQPAYANLNLTLNRLGGNRWTAYNWITNASNAGNDWHLSNDAFLDVSKEPGHAVMAAVVDGKHLGTATILTVPMVGYLAADENGPVPPNVLPQDSPHFVPEYPSASADPKPSDQHVYQDRFIQWVKRHYASSLTPGSEHPIFFMLDNEPDLWSSTHIEVHPQKLSYAELIQRTIAYASAIKKVAPDAPIFGPASYGWNGFVTLQDAIDAKADNAAINPATGKAYGDFLSYYLAQMHADDQTSHRRLLDSLDVHWYPEATGADATGKQVNIQGEDTSPGVVMARMNAPRSLWDPNYVEESWITKYSTAGKPIGLLPRLIKQISENYPGTKLSISEYDYGGGQDISGAIAQADTLGLFGKYGVYAAALWPLQSNEKFLLGAMRMFRSYDAHGGAFGDTSIAAQTSKPAETSIYASTDSAHPGRLVLVAINRTLTDLSAAISLKNNTARYAAFTVYQLTSNSAITPDGSNVLPTLAGNYPIEQLANYTLPAKSISTIVLLTK